MLTTQHIYTTSFSVHKAQRWPVLRLYAYALDTSWSSITIHTVLVFRGGPFVMWKYYSVSLPFVLQWEGACRVQPRDSRHRLLLNHSQGFHRRWIRASSSHAVQGIGKMWPLRFLVVVQSTVAIPLVKIPNIYTKWPNSRSLWMPSCSYIMHCAIMD